MNLFVKLFFLIPVAFIFFASTTFVSADSKSDYDYQYGVYRQSYLEYMVLKKDYLETPSLDNQQKAMLLAKKSIIARDLAKASLSWYLSDLILASRANYPPLKIITDSLVSTRQFYLDESVKAQKIITQDNIKQFSLAYQESTIQPDRIIRFGIVANKVARLVRIQIDSQLALDDLTPKLPQPMPTTVAARVEELKTMHTAINEAIDKMANGLNIAEGEENVDAEIFFSLRTEKMKDIVAMQSDWINRLIDLDLNYANSQN